MSTRAVIARLNGVNGFAGRYHHWDGYPMGLGATLWELSQTDGPFGGDIERMLHVLIDEHPGGWSTINGADWSQEPGYTEWTAKRGPCATCGKPYDRHMCQEYKEGQIMGHADPYPCTPGLYSRHLGHEYVDAWSEKPPAWLNRPECYCHGSRQEDEQLITSKNATDCGCEWAYAIKGTTMVVFSSYSGATKMVGAFGMGDPDATWIPVATVDLRGTEPDWEQMQSAAYG